MDLTLRQVTNFLAKVEQGKPSECWEFTGCRTSQGYGWFRVGLKPYSAHRVAYTIYRGMIPSGSLVLHTCDNPPCVNPFHLYIGDHANNAHDAVTRGRHVGYARGDRHPISKLTNGEAWLIVRLRTAGVPPVLIARMFRISREHVYRIGSEVRQEAAVGQPPVNRVDISSRRGSRHWHAVLTDKSVGEIKALLSQHVKIYLVARQYNVSKAVVGQIKAGKNWLHIPWPPGTILSKDHEVKLTPEKAQTIRDRLSNGERGNHLAREYHVSPGTISFIKNGFRWKSI